MTTSALFKHMLLGCLLCLITSRLLIAVVSILLKLTNQWLLCHVKDDYNLHDAVDNSLSKQQNCERFDILHGE